MSKSLLILSLVVAQLLAGSGGAVYLCWDCGTLLTASAADCQAEATLPHCHCCHDVQPAAGTTPDGSVAATDDGDSPIPLLQRQAPSRIRDSESFLAARLQRELTAPLPLFAADTLGGQGSLGCREPLEFSADSARRIALATVRLRC